MSRKKKDGQNIDKFAESEQSDHLPSWSADGDAATGDNFFDGDVEFFSVEDEGDKGKKRFSGVAKGTMSACNVVDTEGSCLAEQTKVMETSESAVALDADTDHGLKEAFEADALLIEAHQELGMNVTSQEGVETVIEEQVSQLHLDSDKGNLNPREENNVELSLTARVEAIIFASPRPLKVGEILEIIGEQATSKEVSEVISELVASYRERNGGFVLESVRGGYQFQSIPAMSPYMQRMFSARPRPISRAAQETLAIIAYRQPVTRADIEFIRGVDAGSIVKNLLDRGLINAVGRREDAGRPILFGTTDEFLEIYGLKSLSDLPPIESFQPSNDLVNAGLDLVDGHEKPVFEGDFVGSHDDNPDKVQDSLEVPTETSSQF